MRTTYIVDCFSEHLLDVRRECAADAAISLLTTVLMLIHELVFFAAVGVVVHHCHLGGFDFLVENLQETQNNAHVCAFRREKNRSDAASLTSTMSTLVHDSCGSLYSAYFSRTLSMSDEAY